MLTYSWKGDNCQSTPIEITNMPFMFTDYEQKYKIFLFGIISTRNTQIKQYDKIGK